MTPRQVLAADDWRLAKHAVLNNAEGNWRLESLVIQVRFQGGSRRNLGNLPVSLFISSSPLKTFSRKLPPSTYRPAKAVVKEEHHRCGVDALLPWQGGHLYTP